MTRLGNLKPGTRFALKGTRGLVIGPGRHGGVRVELKTIGEVNKRPTISEWHPHIVVQPPGGEKFRPDRLCRAPRRVSSAPISAARFSAGGF